MSARFGISVTPSLKVQTTFLLSPFTVPRFPWFTMPRSSSAAAADSDMIIKDEVVRTLGSELTKLRAAQGQLQTENERLLRELEETRVSLRALEEKQKKRAEAVEDVVPVGSRRNLCLILTSYLVHGPRTDSPRV